MFIYYAINDFILAKMKRIIVFRGSLQMTNVNLNKIEEAVRLILEAVGEDPNREGFWILQKEWLKCMKKF